MAFFSPGKSFSGDAPSLNLLSDPIIVPVQGSVPGEPDRLPGTGPEPQTDPIPARADFGTADQILVRRPLPGKPLEVDGTRVGGGLLLQRIALATEAVGQAALPTLETAAAPPQGGGGSRYQDNLGDALNPLSPVGPIPLAALAFGFLSTALRLPEEFIVTTLAGNGVNSGDALAAMTDFAGESAKLSGS